MKAIIEKLLAILARQIIKKYQPEIVGITGSLGKTSCANAVYAVLAPVFNTRQNIKNYNNEIGLPLTIIYSTSGGKSIWKWLEVFGKALKLLLVKDENYPNVLILEMGADIKGDLDYLMSIARPKIGVLTAVSETHLQPTNPKAKNESYWFKDLKGVLREKEKIALNLPKDGTAILNYDDENVLSVADKVRCKMITYGFNTEADLIASEAQFSGLEENICQTDFDWECKTWGVSFKVKYQGSVVPVFLPGCFGRQHIYAALAGIAVGLACGLNMVSICEALKNYRPVKGRMNLIPGIKHTMIIDDSYNAPAAKAVLAALDAQDSINLSAGKRKIAVLGDMLELGAKSDDAHREVGLKIAEMGINMLITVGKLSKLISISAVEAGFNKENVFHFVDAAKAGKFIRDIIQEGDLILVKGSQGARMEKIAKGIMAEPERAKDLLVRQEDEWESR